LTNEKVLFWETLPRQPASLTKRSTASKNVPLGTHRLRLTHNTAKRVVIFFKEKNYCTEDETQLRLEGHSTKNIFLSKRGKTLFGEGGERRKTQGPVQATNNPRARLSFQDHYTSCGWPSKRGGVSCETSSPRN